MKIYMIKKLRLDFFFFEAAKESGAAVLAEGEICCAG